MLDVGCGCGDIALKLAHLEYQVTEIDLEAVRIQKANAMTQKYSKGQLFSRKRFEDLDNS